MTEEIKINNIPWDAPLFRKAPLIDLNTVIENLSKAGYYYADDSGREWANAGALMREAAIIVNTHVLGYSAIRALHSHKPQLVTIDQFMNTILTEARKK